MKSRLTRPKAPEGRARLLARLLVRLRARLLLLLVLGAGTLASCVSAAYVERAPAAPPADLDAWLEARESAVPGLIWEDRRQIEWAGAPGQRTPYSLVYIHGFQGSPRDYAAVVEQAARTLGANVYFARLKGHSVTTDEIADVSLGDWIDDTREAMEIGSLIGERVIAVGSSMGADLCLWLAAQRPPRLAALVLFSCAIEPRERSASLLEWPWPVPQILLGVVIGRYRANGFDSLTYPTGDPALWNRLYPPRYRSESFLKFMSVVKLTRTLPLEGITVPSLWLYSRRDDTIDLAALKRAWARVGGAPKRLVPVSGAHGHMLAGEVFSPETTPEVSADIAAFLAQAGL